MMDAACADLKGDELLSRRVFDPSQGHQTHVVI
jgi:hypothetical protein